MDTRIDNKSKYAALVGLAKRRGLTLHYNVAPGQVWKNGRVDMILSRPSKLGNKAMHMIERCVSLSWMHECILRYEIVK